MSDHYQLTNSTSDFKSRSNDIFDKLINLEKQHDVHTKNQTSLILPDEDASSSKQNPSIPKHAITFKKRAADDETFIRPVDKWKKYDLDDVNEHHMSGRGNQHALNDFLRTRTKPVEVEVTTSEQPIFQRPMKKEVLANKDDDDDDQAFVPIRAPVTTKSNEPNRNDNGDDDDDEKTTTDYKLTSIRKPTRGVFSTNEKKPIKTPMDIPEEEEKSGDDEEEEDDDDVNDELLEP